MTDVTQHQSVDVEIEETKGDEGRIGTVFVPATED